MVIIITIIIIAIITITIIIITIIIMIIMGRVNFSWHLRCLPQHPSNVQGLKIADD